VKFREFYQRDDPEESWRFEEEPKSVSLLGVTVGCGCCSETVPVSREGMRAHIESLQEKIRQAEALLGIL